MKKTSFNALRSVILLLLLSILPNISLAFFSDVPADYPQYKAIKALADGNLIKGYPDGTFKPENFINKSEFLKIAFSDLGFTPNEKTYQTDFKDVPIASWFAPYVQKALEIGAVSFSKADENFHPGSYINKIEAIRMAFGIEGIATPYYTNINPTDLFQDVDSHAWFAYLAKAAKANGIISTKNPDYFLPFKSLTRGDAAEMIYQTHLTRENGGSGGTFTITLQPSPLQGVDATTSSLLNNPKFAILLDIWKKANTDFYYKNNVNQDDMVYGAIEGLVDKLGDKFTTFQEPLKAQELANFLQGEFEGIGTSLDIINNKIVILTPIVGSPAEKAGLKSGDIILKINNQAVDNLTLENVLALIKGPAGTSVHLTVSRNGQTFDFDIVRAKITLTSVSSKMINNVAYIRIQQFLNSTPQEFTDAVNTLLQSSPKGFVLDLRGNPGGYLDAAIDVAGHFIAQEKVVTETKTAEGVKTPFNSVGKAELGQKPIVVLMNEGTASAAEILAGALQDDKIATLVGTKSYGKGSVQEIFSYDDNSTLKISIAHWLTPLERDINGIGLIPDIAVDDNNQAAVQQNLDPQLDRAVVEIQKR